MRVVWRDMASFFFVTTTPILAVPYFTKPFVMECDAFGMGLGAILTQEGRHIAFTCRKLCDRNLGKSTYEK